MKRIFSFCMYFLFFSLCTGCSSMFSAQNGFFNLGDDSEGSLADNQDSSADDSRPGGDQGALSSARGNTYSTPQTVRRPSPLSALQGQSPYPLNPFTQNSPINAMSPLQLVFVNGNTWRTQAPPDMVYGIMARLLSQSYIMSGADRKNFTLQTDWDKFFIEGRLFRNRMSVMVFPVGPRQTEIVIKNTVEYYTGGAGQKEEGELWLPSPDVTDEVVKLVDNTNKHTAFAYNQSVNQR